MSNAIRDPIDRLSTIIEGEKSPFVELSKRMQDTSKDVQNLNLSILDLAIALEKRAGVNKEKDTNKIKEDKKPEQDRTIVSDTKDFFKGIKDYVQENKNYFLNKSSLPANVEKPKLDISAPEPANVEKPKLDISAPEPEVVVEKIIKQDTEKTTDDKNIVTSDNNQPDENQNKVLSDMVAVLIDMRDDKSQKQLVEEAAAIKKIIADQNKKPELPGGIEPNTDEAKDMEREKLAEAIARKIGEVFNAGATNPFNQMMLDPDLADRPTRTGPGKTGPGGPPTGQPKTPGPGNKTPPTSGGSKFKLPKMPPGVGKAAMIGGRATGIGSLMLGAIEASEYLDETGYGDKLNQGAGQNAEKAFKNINADFSKLDITPEQAQDILDQPDSPGKQRDLKAFGGEDELKKRAAERKKIEQASLRKYDYVEPKTSPKIDPFEPKPTESGIGKILNEVSDKNTELKMFNMEENAATQMLAPIISNRTINNTEQTMITNSPSPHSNSNSFNRWQSYRSGYTDSIK